MSYVVFVRRFTNRTGAKANLGSVSVGGFFPDQRRPLFVKLRRLPMKAYRPLGPISRKKTRVLKEIDHRHSATTGLLSQRDIDYRGVLCLRRPV